MNIKTSTALFIAFIVLYIVDPPAVYYESGAKLSNEMLGPFLLKYFLIALVILYFSNSSDSQHNNSSTNESDSQDKSVEVTTEKLKLHELEGSTDNVEEVNTVESNQRQMEHPTNLESDVGSNIRSHAFYTWMVIPGTLFLPWIETKPSDSGGGVAGLFFIGFLIFMVSSCILTKKVWRNRESIGDGTFCFGLSPIFFGSMLLITFLVSFFKIKI